MKLTAYYYSEQKKLVLQKANYIEDGPYIEVENLIYFVFEIPAGGGTSELIKECKNINEAIDVMERLT